MRSLAAKESLQSLQNALKSNKNIEFINKICEETESAINLLKSYDSVTPKEKREQILLVNDLSQCFESTLQNMDKTLEKQETIEFDQLNQEILKERHDQIKKIEKKITHVAEIMKECSAVTNSQGADLNRIDSEISFAKKNTSDAVNEIKTTNKNQKRKRGCCIIMLIITSCLLLGVIIVALVLGKA